MTKDLDNPTAISHDLEHLSAGDAVTDGRRRIVVAKVLEDPEGYPIYRFHHTIVSRGTFGPVTVDELLQSGYRKERRS